MMSWLVTDWKTPLPWSKVGGFGHWLPNDRLWFLGCLGWLTVSKRIEILLDINKVHCMYVRVFATGQIELGCWGYRWETRMGAVWVWCERRSIAVLRHWMESVGGKIQSRIANLGGVGIVQANNWRWVHRVYHRWGLCWGFCWGIGWRCVGCVGCVEVWRPCFGASTVWWGKQQKLGIVRVWSNGFWGSKQCWVCSFVDIQRSRGVPEGVERGNIGVGA